MKPFITFFLQNTKIPVCLLSIVLVIPSCTINKFKPLTVEQATKYNNRRITIKTLNGNVFKLKWIEEKNEDLVSLKDTKRVRIDTSKIQMIRVGQLNISLDSALNHSGNIQISTKNRNYTLLSIESQGANIIGIKRTGNEILPVVIPKDQIKKIKVKDKGSSTIANIVLGIVIAYVILFFA